MRKTTIEVDDELIARASAILGTRGLQATVRRALEEIVAREARLRLLERLRTMEGLDLGDAAVRRPACSATPRCRTRCSATRPRCGS